MTPQASIDAATADSLSPEAEERLTRILEKCVEEMEQGSPPDVEQLAAAHPDLAEPLKAHLASVRLLHQMGAEMAPLGDRPFSGPEFGTKQLGDFSILREIGRGGMGIVYEARQLSLDRRVAVKVLPFAAVLDQKQIERFKSEARAAAQLHHPNIVPVFSVGCERGVHYYAMQYVDGQSLDVVIRQLRCVESPADSSGENALRDAAEPSADSSVGNVLRGVPEPSERHSGRSLQHKQWSSPPTASGGTTVGGVSGSSADTGSISGAWRQTALCRSFRTPRYAKVVAEIGVQVAGALHYAHEYGVIHRDVKPSNLLLDGEGKVWITDFGLARFQTESRSSRVTMTGDVVGTLRYMSPEQAAGRPAAIGEQTDVYSLGIALYELLTLRDAFEGTDRQDVLRRIADEEPVPPRRLNSAIPADLETILLKAISKSADARYVTAKDFADDLRRFLEAKPILARRPSLAERFAKWGTRHKAIVRSIAALAAVALIGLTVSTLLVMRANSNARKANQQLEAALKQSEENRGARNFISGRHGWSSTILACCMPNGLPGCPGRSGSGNGFSRRR